jgi:hypothetical protein
MNMRRLRNSGNRDPIRDLIPFFPPLERPGYHTNLLSKARLIQILAFARLFDAIADGCPHRFLLDIFVKF